MYYTYVLRSLSDYNLYVGFTEDLKRRFSEHNSGLVDATRSRQPLELVYYEACLDKGKVFQNWFWKKIFERKNTVVMPR